MNKRAELITHTWKTIYDDLKAAGVSLPPNFDGVGAAYGAAMRIGEALDKYAFSILEAIEIPRLQHQSWCDSAGETSRHRCNCNQSEAFYLVQDILTARELTNQPLKP